MKVQQLPFRKHLQWLIIEGESANEIRKFYNNIQFVRPDDKLIQEAEDRVAKMMIPLPTRKRIAKGVYNDVDLKMMKRLGFEAMYKRRTGQKLPDWSNVGRILNHPVMRIAIECATLVKINPDELCSILPQSFGIDIRTPDLELFLEYFFDTKDFERADWVSYLQELSSDHYIYVRYQAALTKSQDEVMYLVGLPTKGQFTSFLKNVLATADYKFKYFTRQNSAEADEEARKWAKLGIEAGIRHEKFSASDASDFAKLIQTSFNYIEEDMPTVSSDMVASIKPQIASVDSAGKVVKAHSPPPMPDMVHQPELPQMDSSTENDLPDIGSGNGLVPMQPIGHDPQDV